jgi:hypothetical protein
MNYNFTDQMIDQTFEVLAAIQKQDLTIGEITAKYGKYGNAVIDAAYQMYDEMPDEWLD